MIFKNKVVKVSLCLIVAGIIFASVGYAFGGAKYTIKNFKVVPYSLESFIEGFDDNNTIYNDSEDDKDEFMENFSDDSNDSKDTNNNASINNKSNNRVNDDKELDDFDNIDLSVDVGKVKIIKGDKNKIEAKYYKDRDDLSYSVENKKLIVKSKNHSNAVNWNFNETNKNLELTITMVNTEPKNINANINTGKLELNDLNLENSHIKNTTGEICGTNLITKDLNVENITGEIKIDGELNGKNEVKCVTGDINLTTSLNKDDYTYDASIAVGNGKIDGRKYKDVVNNNNNNNNSKE